MKNSWSCGRAAVPRTLIFRTVRMQDLILKTFMDHRWVSETDCSSNQQQRIVYNGHKRVHLLKFQSVAPPNGLIGNMYGPVGMLVIYIFLLQRFRSRFSQYSRLLFGREWVCVALFLCLITLL